MLRSDSFEVSGDEKVDHLIPLLILAQLSSQDQYFSGEDPEHHGDGLSLPIAAWDDNIDEIKRGISVAESDSGNVDIGSLNNSLSVGFGVSNNQNSGLLEFLSDLIGQRSGNPSRRSTGSATGVLPELIHSPLAEIFSAHNNNIIEIGNRCNDTSGKFDLLQNLINFEYIVPCTIFALGIFLHIMIKFSSTKMNLWIESHYTLAERSLRISFCSDSVAMVMYDCIFC